MKHSSDQVNTLSNNIGVFLPNHAFHDQSTNDLEGLCNDDQPHIPLLLRKCYARSKSSMHDDLRHFRISLKWCALDHSTPMGKFISYLTFVVLAIVIPTTTSLTIKIPSSSPSEDPLSFNKLVQVPESGLAFIGFLTLCSFFKDYGLRQLLFLDGLNDDSSDVQRGYKAQLDKAFKYLASILLPSFLVEFAHKILFFSTVVVSFPVIGVGVVPMNSVLFLSGLASWVYRTGLFLLVCVLFRLTCELQLLRLEGLKHMLEGFSAEQPGVIFREHRRIREQLYVTSHRFRFFIVGCLVVITVSQLGALLLVLASKSEKNFFNSGDLVVWSAVQLSGFFLCLMGAARITHRAQGLVSVATRWHMLVTSSSTGSDHIKDLPDMDRSPAPNTNERVDSEPTSDNVITISHDPYAFQARQALLTYLQHNKGGITLFGFTLDRGLLHTLFAFEFSLVLWILSKVTVVS